jgi:hypothetical protein
MYPIMLWLLGIPANKKGGCVNAGCGFHLKQKRRLVKNAAYDMEGSIKIA